jgi:hypothetical protein
MSVLRERGWKDKITKIVVYPFLVLDALVNIFILTVWFVELPRQLLVTTRMKHWRKKYEGQKFTSLSWLEQKRLLFAVWLCDGHLDPLDITGDHC